MGDPVMRPVMPRRSPCEMADYIQIRHWIVCGIPLPSRISGHVWSRCRIGGYPRVMEWLDLIGGRYWVRTSDPCRVKAVLYH